MVMALQGGTAEEVLAAATFLLDIGICPAEDVLHLQDRKPTNCFKIAAEAGMDEQIVQELRTLLELELRYRASIEDKTPTKLDRFFGLLKGDRRERVKAQLRQLSVHRFSDLQAMQGRPDVLALANMYPGFNEALDQVQKEGEGVYGAKPRVVLLCVDNNLTANARAIAAFRDASERGLCVIPLIFPGYNIVNYSHWWPENLPELSRHAIFVDFRDGATLHPKAVFELIPQVIKFLEEWRGEAADPAAMKTVLSKVPCPQCAAEAVENPDSFDRDECLSALDRFRNRSRALKNVLQGINALHASRMLAATPPTDGGPSLHQTQPVHDPAHRESVESDEGLQRSCSNGHRVPVADVLSRAVIYDALPCPQCVLHGEAPPFCFNRSRCLLYFDEHNSDRIGALECHKCRAAGRPASVRILDIVSPEVFISYNWGVKSVVDGTVVWSSHSIVKPLRRRLDVEDEVVCWLDVGGGMGAGQDLKAEMIEGVRKSTVVLIFLSDLYVNSGNCKIELEHSIAMGKYIIPVLLPCRGKINGISSGWTGPGPENRGWWMHASSICHDNLHPETGKLMSWSVLKEFVPIDMREKGQELPKSAAELEIRRRIVSRFHRVQHTVHKREASRALWARVRAHFTAAYRLRMAFPTRTASCDRVASCDSRNEDGGEG
mmetsp:Transcript_69115/g.144098  ORF Transcript_69115/g.144098 Transcript_69115/m.144098 type:complete len:662 (-) Transcript_69115:402-2387(-)